MQKKIVGAPTETRSPSIPTPEINVAFSLIDANQDKFISRAEWVAFLV